MKRSILFFVESLSGGGAERVLVTLLKHFDYQKYNVTLLTLVDTGLLKEEIKGLPIDYKAVISASRTRWGQIRNKIKYKMIYQWLPIRIVNRWIVPQKKVDVYVAFTEGFATKLLSYSPQKKIAWVHIDLKSYPWTLNEHIYRNQQEEIKAYSKYNKVICVSHSVEKVMKSFYGLQNTMTNYNPIDSEDILKKAKKNSDIIVTNEFNIVSVGRLVYQKGYDLLIPLIARLHNKGYLVQLYILGEGKERKNLDQLIKKEGMAEFVHLLGYMKNPYPFMKQMDLFVCSSRAEGYSLVIAEALVLGLPVVSMNCSGPNELLDGGKYGALCDDYFALEEMIGKAIKDKDYYQDLKVRASLRQSFFDVSKTITQVEDLIDSL